MNGVDVVDVDIADDLRVRALADREHDPRRIAGNLPPEPAAKIPESARILGAEDKSSSG